MQRNFPELPPNIENVNSGVHMYRLCWYPSSVTGFFGIRQKMYERRQLPHTKPLLLHMWSVDQWHCHHLRSY